MAPDITQLGANSSALSNGGTDIYQMPDITFRDPKNRRLRVLTIGAGVSGILMAYNIQKQCEK
jgi:hydroxyversicolorone monooxygenase